MIVVWEQLNLSSIIQTCADAVIPMSLLTASQGGGRPQEFSLDFVQHCLVALQCFGLATFRFCGFAGWMGTLLIPAAALIDLKCFTTICTGHWWWWRLKTASLRQRKSAPARHQVG